MNNARQTMGSLLAEMNAATIALVMGSIDHLPVVIAIE
jgi:hypothetical protein